jgi:hypothetical protein
VRVFVGQDTKPGFPENGKTGAFCRIFLNDIPSIGAIFGLIFPGGEYSYGPDPRFFICLFPGCRRGYCSMSFTRIILESGEYLKSGEFF